MFLSEECTENFTTHTHTHHPVSNTTARAVRMCKNDRQGHTHGVGEHGLHGVEETARPRVSPKQGQLSKDSACFPPASSVD